MKLGGRTAGQQCTNMGVVHTGNASSNAVACLVLQAEVGEGLEVGQQAQPAAWLIHVCDRVGEMHVSDEFWIACRALSALSALSAL